MKFTAGQKFVDFIRHKKEIKERKIAFLMPIHPPHFEYAKNFLESFEYYKLDKQADFYFVFSNEEDKKACNTKYGSIVLPDNLKDINRERGIINVKKLYGVYELKDRYDYIIVLDSESLIIKNIDLLEVCETFFSNKILWGVLQYHGKSDNMSKMTKYASDFFEEKDRIKDDGLDLWFNNLCIYKASTIEDFFIKTNLKENITKLTFWHFDYYMYMYYLLLYHSFKPRNFLNIYNGCASKFYTICVDFMTKYMNIATPEKHKEITRLVGRKNKIFILIHLDRGELPSDQLLPENKYKNKVRYILSCFIPNKVLKVKIRNGY